MLLWRLSEHSKSLLALELLAMSLVGHCLVGFFLFVVYKGNATSIHIDIGGGGKRRYTVIMPQRKASSRRYACACKAAAKRAASYASKKVSTGQALKAKHYRPRLGSTMSIIQEIVQPNDTKNNKKDEKLSSPRKHRKNLQHYCKNSA